MERPSSVAADSGTANGAAGSNVSRRRRMAFPLGREPVTLDYGRAVAVATPVRGDDYCARN